MRQSGSFAFAVSVSAVRVCDFVKRNGDTFDRADKSHNDHGKDLFLARSLGQLYDLCLVKNFTVEESGFKSELTFRVVCKFAKNFCGSDRIVIGKGDGGASGQVRSKTFKTCFLSCKAKNGVLYDGVFNTGFTKLAAKFGIVGNVDSDVVNKNAGLSCFKLSTASFFACKIFSLGI